LEDCTESYIYNCTNCQL